MTVDHNNQNTEPFGASEYALHLHPEAIHQSLRILLIIYEKQPQLFIILFLEWSELEYEKDETQAFRRNTCIQK